MQVLLQRPILLCCLGGKVFVCLFVLVQGVRFKQAKVMKVLQREILFPFYGWGVLAQAVEGTYTISYRSSQNLNSDLVPISSFYHKIIFLPFITCRQSMFINNQYAFKNGIPLFLLFYSNSNPGYIGQFIISNIYFPL